MYTEKKIGKLAYIDIKAYSSKDYIKRVKLEVI